MGAKEFLMPGIKKTVVFAVIYFILMPLLFCINAELGCSQVSWAGCSCPAALNVISLYPAEYFAMITLGLFSFSGAYFALLWFGVTLSYLLSCIIVYFWWSGSSC